MKYRLYKLEFSAPVHFGSRKLESANMSLPADSLFSALCIEAKSLYGVDGIKKLYAFSAEQGLIFSDLFPYCGDEYYLPKPMLKVESELSGSSVLKKKYKNTKYVSASLYSDYIRGTLEKEPDFAEEYIYTKIERNRDLTENTVPYFVDSYSFNKNCGLYFIIGYSSEEQLDFVDGIMHALSYDGIGGRISSGFGKFTSQAFALPDSIAALVEKAESSEYLITVSTCLPKDDELEEAMRNARYTLQKRSGFIASGDYADENVKKRDLYTFAAGSVFKNAFSGDIYDVSCGGRHPVYRYAIPFFIGI